MTHQQSQASQGNVNQQYLTFVMGREEYGVEILCVQEIRGWQNTTVLPNAPAHIKGVINLRGIIVPIIDLRQRFGIEELSYGPTTVVIVVKIAVEKQFKVIGIVVDAVSDVIIVDDDELRATPDFGLETDIRFIKGLTSINDNMVILLDVHMLLGNEMLPSASQLSSIINQLEIDSSATESE
ncbi:purine-binding chemotaxis protein CheW [Shewanella sp. WXL01]|uniref:Chemotaxis protein CheW n=1 Tax=Shewanella maritima TaxID=2520507 RepID=A0A411PJ15_9GAMM|nr:MULTISPECIES: chemotaxis protein CheW [Shewanella]NKF52138.1 purine-binding chemotaxis protein CheW [Shewanella sp. WXL01]QBF83402.1 purine-binding chemotaxis protein CheW [Shewanella maritima]